MVNDPKNSTLYTFGLYGAVGIQLAASVVAGLAFGAWFDKKVGTSPWFALVGTILGAVGGIWNLVRILKWNEKKEKSDV
ncbi:MAG: AtpZ/AtpI family protein [Deltaproteobacteria bacterium]|nr:AtpZ/AtpI family protein [Deltaproteobacteria bacterium]MBI2341728.1 AtpZ/AtpI family protein [Deltaproteobacteria bacterium]